MRPEHQAHPEEGAALSGSANRANAAPAPVAP
jgi:hypothetical protein